CLLVMFLQVFSRYVGGVGKTFHVFCNLLTVFRKGFGSFLPRFAGYFRCGRFHIAFHCSGSALRWLRIRLWLCVIEFHRRVPRIVLSNARCAGLFLFKIIGAKSRPVSYALLFMLLICGG